jgi:DNA-binding NarL/FixJ family response regulator
MSVQETAPERPRLTKREQEILQATVDGLTARQIARRLYVSTKTVNTHLQGCYRKLDAHSKVQAVVAGIRTGAVRL